jgi:Tol biopolymer transport system component
VLSIVGYQLLVIGSAFSQNGYFGKNKVHYSKFDWYYIQSDHFDVYFDKDHKYLAEFTAEVAESALVSYATTFRHKLESRIPIIVYFSHNSFQQTNVVQDYLEEGIGGVTEIFKNRMVVPFEGDYVKFRHVIRHELVHAVINEMFYGGSLQTPVKNKVSFELPLWFNEGLAEYLALEWDTNSDMFMRDAVISKYLPTKLDYLQGYFAYRGGQSLWWYISRKYGKEKVGEVIKDVKILGNVEEGFKLAIGLNLDELAKRWQWDLQNIYWLDIAARKQVSEYAEPLTDHTKDGSFYNTSPAISPRGDKLAYIANDGGYFCVFLMDVESGRVTEKLVTGGKTGDFEEIHLITPRISWSPDEKFIAMAVKAGAEDAIMIIDVKEGEMEKLTFGLDGIFSVTWSPQGDKLTFVGNIGNQSDIYVYDLKSKNLANVTNDIASDSDPIWSPSGKQIYFSSDRNNSLVLPNSAGQLLSGFKDKDLYCVTVENGKVSRVFGWEGSDEVSPVVSSDGGKLLFISDRNGINNIYEWDILKNQCRPITNSLSGIYQLSLSYDNTRLAFVSFVKGDFNIFLMRDPFHFEEVKAEPAPTWFFEYKRAKSIDLSQSLSSSAKDSANNVTVIFGVGQSDSTAFKPDSLETTKELITGNKEADGSYKSRKYKLNFSPDLIYTNAGYNTFYGFSGPTIFVFSDMLGDHKLFLITSFSIDLKNSDYGIFYYYLKNRINFGISALHTARFAVLNDVYGGSWYRLRVWNINGVASYPLDKFNRLDFGIGWYDISKLNLDIIEPIDERIALVPAFAYVHDNSLWGFAGPANGSRSRVNLAFSPPIGRKGLSFVNVTFDYRNYLNFGRYYTFAVRVAGGGSFGRNSQRFIIGGVESWLNYEIDGRRIPIQNAEDFVFMELGVPLRGFNYNAASGSRYGLLNLELRYPMLGFLQLSTLPIWLQSFGGSFFFDAGAVWSRERELRFFERTANGSLRTRDLLMGIGIGTRIYFLGFLVKLDVAWRWNFDSFSKPKYYLSLGTDF